ncbi:endonuclease domain-containing protein [Gordonia sp. DT218]|uniref:endonuclease domain-containing protein n=1 Tax=Gordonia sp. DT218 TaxID=3416659 RepID=UPI003CE931B6
MTRFRLRSRGIGVRSQVAIPAVGIVDFVVGTSMIIEVDGYETHSSKEQFEKDRERDRKAVELGYVVIRLTYHQVVHEWPDVEETILDLIRRREHLKPVVERKQLVSDDT